MDDFSTHATEDRLPGWMAADLSGGDRQWHGLIVDREVDRTSARTRGGTIENCEHPSWQEKRLTGEAVLRRYGTGRFVTRCRHKAHRQVRVHQFLPSSAGADQTIFT
ncbi:hypothetical protein [Muricoccus vinaceus]|uniref:hypothetical protein n=1 Tax=Muricoccus vinaceus TaxID=424704 RepID=UPI003670BE33